MLLFLLPLSCIVVSIGNIANKLSFFSTSSSSTTSNSQAFILPSMLSSNNTGMDILAGFAPVNGFEVRGKISSTNKNKSSDSSMSLTISPIAYHERMANNGMDIDLEPVNNSPVLSYETEQERAIYFSKATKLLGNTRLQDRNIEATTSNPEHVLNVNQSEHSLCSAVLQTDDNNVINI